MITEQICRKCNQCKSIDNFNKDKTMKNGYKLYCKICRQVESKAYSSREEVKDRVSNYSKEYYTKNIDKIVEYYSKPTTQKRLKEYRKSDKNKQIQKRYREENKEKILTNTHIRNARKKNQLHPDHDKKIEEQMVQECFQLEKDTGYKWSVDHIYPLYHGGPHWHLNLQVIPHLFNLQKNNKLNYMNIHIKHWTDLPAEVLNWIKNRDSQKMNYVGNY